MFCLLIIIYLGVLKLWKEILIFKFLSFIINVFVKNEISLEKKNKELFKKKEYFYL